MNAEDNNSTLRSLLEYLRTARGFDFSVYKGKTLTRRIAKRLQSVGASDYKEYIDYLEVHPEEFTSLFNTILINVTSFFRDGQAWETVSRDIVPRILGNKRADEAIRVWSAGCSSGEEAYTLALVFCDALGLEAFRNRVKIYATDIDEDALVHARAGRYTQKDLDPVPEEMRDKFFEIVGTTAIVKPELRRAVVFGRHDLVQDAPISRMDLLVCRNTLMYFNAEVQDRVLRRFHYALNDNGFLFLGKAEMALATARLFAPVDMRLRIFLKIPTTYPLERAAVLGQAEVLTTDDAARRLNLREQAFESASGAQVVVDAEGRIAIINELARSMFGLGAKDLDQPFQNIELSYRPVELRSLIQKALGEHQIVALKDLPYSPKEGVMLFLDVEVKPLFGENRHPLGVAITFVDTSRVHGLQQEIERSRQEQETASEELQSANEELQATNEELQSTVEELQTTNEELQSTNEEMETMNEELQSTNEELRNINDQYRLRTEELDQANGFMDSILASLSVGVIAVDPELKILLWNKGAKHIWGLDADEVRGKSLLQLDIGMPMDKLAGPIRAAISGSGVKKVWLDAVDRRGKAFRCRTTISASPGSNHEARGAVLVMEED